ncbi:tyrosine-type recombinase/integrase [Nocardioides kongjuensis]|uniref:Integrase n=1 Tax=Nocardioides kongjuensis TaxID=349522 RepID=A0A852R6Z7_9ACTN|nr:tyrosine-type recombinase/integrase [Nocardioides kongjuensis]NYD29361.1 integrase [Nocardioides kongjuensis]
MAWVERRERTSTDGKRTITYRVRWRESDGRARAKTFRRKVEADRFAAMVSADLVRGHYIDPDAGKVRFEEYANQWLAAQTFEEGTVEMVELRFRLHVMPHLGARNLSDVQPSTIQGWLRTLTGLSGNYRKVIYANVSSVFTAAVDDGLIPKNPCKAPSVRRPKSDPRKFRPWTRERVLAVREELPDRFKLVVDLGVGLGLRQGEIFGLSLDDIDLNTGEIEIRRQVKLLGNNRQLFGLPKGRKIRTVPLPDRVLELINDHVTRYPPRSVTLPWDRSDGASRSVDLVLFSRESGALNRNYFNPKIWRPALVAAGVEPKRENGCHALRHFYASTLLDAGESILALSEYLGHADPGFTLRTYTHLMPSSTERTKAAIDEILSVPSAPHEPE